MSYATIVQNGQLASQTRRRYRKKAGKKKKGRKKRKFIGPRNAPRWYREMVAREEYLASQGTTQTTMYSPQSTSTMDSSMDASTQELIYHPGSQANKRMRGTGDYTFGPYTYKGHTPFASVGKHIGGMFGKPWGRIGEGFGHIIGRILGSGDYQTGPMVRSNVLTNSTEVPQFADIGRANVVIHREYIGDVITSSTIGAFKNESYDLQPANNRTFPWLSTIAENYEQYRIHGMVFFFKSTSGESVASTNTAIGTVILATEYNVDSPAFTNKQAMENSQFAQSGKASVSMIHGIECDLRDRPLNNYFIQPDGTQGNDRFTNFGKFQIATQGFQAASVNVGELWVSYVIEFFKPQVPRNIGGSIPTTIVSRVCPTIPVGLFGTSDLASKGNLTVTFNNPSTQITIANVYPEGIYHIACEWTGSLVNPFVVPVLSSITGGDLIGLGSGGSGYYQIPEPGISATIGTFSLYMKIKDTNHSGSVTVNFTAPGLPYIYNSCKLLVTQLDGSVQ